MGQTWLFRSSPVIPRVFSSLNVRIGSAWLRHRVVFCFALFFRRTENFQPRFSQYEYEYGQDQMDEP